MLLVVTSIITQTSCSRNTEPVHKDGYYLDTFCRISIYDMERMSEERASQVIDEAFELCEQYEGMFSKSLEGSDIYSINHAGGEPVECFPETVELIEKGINYGVLSGGKFDITIGKVSDLWDFHSDDAQHIEFAIPDHENILSAVSHVDYNCINIDGNEVWLSDEEAQIDLGGIAKGYIEDKVTQLLIERGVTSAVIDLGGNVSTIGYKDGENTPFLIGIMKPYSKGKEMIGGINSHDNTIVTSGVYERYIEVAGKKYHHVLDNKTGYPVENELISVTVIGSNESSADCDALSTTCLILGKDEGLKLIERTEGVEAVFIDYAGEIYTSEGFAGFE